MMKRQARSDRSWTEKSMSARWALQDAKSRLSEVVESAIAQGPQTITRRGRDTAVLPSVDDFRKLTGSAGNLVTFFRGSPLAGADLALDRNHGVGRLAVWSAATPTPPPARCT
jgi:prevent-host-death family protein